MENHPFFRGELLVFGEVYTPRSFSQRVFTPEKMMLGKEDDPFPNATFQGRTVKPPEKSRLVAPPACLLDHIFGPH